jgi:signal transduction histidine kinase
MRSPLGIKARLMALAAVTALPLVALAGVAIISFINVQRAQLQDEVAAEVNGLVYDVDRQAKAVQVELRMLASLPSVQSGDLAAFHKQLSAAVKVYGTALVLLDTRGQQLVNTNLPYGEPLPYATRGGVYDRVAATGLPQVSDLIMGPTLHQPIISVDVPVMRDGRVVYVLAMGIKPPTLSEALLSPKNLALEAVPPTWTVAIVDSKGIILARNRELNQFLGKPVAPLLRKAMFSGTEDSWIENITSDGTPVYSTFRTSSLTGWSVAIGVPREFVDGPQRRAWILAVGGGITFVALSLVLAYWMAQAIRRPVDKLAAMAKEMGSGEAVGRLYTGVRELNLVGDALYDAASRLLHHREHLEEVVAQRTQELADVNNQLRTEIEAREQAQITLLQTQKMEAIGQLTGGIAHDFNNLLTVACGALDTLGVRIADENSLRLVRSAQSAMWRGATLTRALLAFARKQRLEPVLADLNSVILEMSEMLRRSIGPTVEIRHSLASELWPVLIDIGQIETALLNVAINARDAMPRGGTLSIATANVGNELLEEVAARDCVLVSVSDTGTGMSPEVMKRAFDPFFTTKEFGRGTGLGLSMVFGVVHQSGGTVRLRSQAGNGTTVLIYLPQATGASASADGAGSSAARLRGDARVLVVDDDDAVREMTVESLRNYGYSTVEADSGEAALTLLKGEECCDLVVMDAVMPGLSGQETARLARRARPALKVLFLSGYAADDDRGGDIWLMKPFKAQSLAEAVSKALQ